MGALKKFIESEALSGFLLLAAAVLALVLDNSAFAPYYNALLDTRLGVVIGDYEVHKPILLWINDGLMALFFLLVGLEIKREFLAGELSTKGQIILPGIAAASGMAVPAILYAAVTWHDPFLLRGWAIPAATDIAFALAVLAVLGRRVPIALKIFLLTVAILDDLGAILVIALFYTLGLSPTYLLFSALAFLVLVAMNRAGVVRPVAYLAVGAVLWVLILKSGVHATLAGVLVAMTLPMRNTPSPSPLERLEVRFHPYVAFLVMPLFAFANAGVSFEGIKPSFLLQSLPLGIFLGLFAGKQLGIFGAVYASVKLGLAKLPSGMGWAQVYGAACLAGIGFTMSLFIGMLAFDEPEFAPGVRIGVLTASLASAIVGYLVLRFAGRKGRHEAT